MLIKLREDKLIRMKNHYVQKIIYMKEMHICMELQVFKNVLFNVQYPLNK